jgi:prepilin-type processing-associated H-X9-DG protein
MTKALTERLHGEFNKQYEEEALKEGPSRDVEKLRGIGEKVSERVYGQARTKVTRMVEFAGDQDEWRYVARDAKLGEAGKPVCWWRPKGSKTYRVLFGDLTVRDMTHAALPPVAQAKEPLEWLPTRDDVDMAGCRRNLKQIGTALLMYTKANDHKFPEALDELVPFLEDRSHLTCPASKDDDGGYIYAKPGGRLTEIERPGDFMLVFDRFQKHTFGRNVLFADGRVAWLAEEDFKQRWVEQQKAFNLAGLSELGDEAALRRACQGRLRALGAGVFRYLKAHDNRYPDTFDAVIAFSDMFLSNQVLTCPAVGGRGVDFIYIKRADTLSAVANPAQTIVMFDKPGNHPGGRNALFATSEVKWLTEEEFQKLRAEQEGHPAPKGSASAREGHEEGSREGR